MLPDRFISTIEADRKSHAIKSCAKLDKLVSAKEEKTGR